MFGCKNCNIDNPNFDPNGHLYGSGGILFLGDLYDSNITNPTLIPNAADYGAGLICTDCARNNITNFTYGGYANGSTGDFGVNNSDAIVINSAGGPCADNNIIGGSVSFASGSTKAAVHIQAGNSTAVCDGNKVIGLNVEQFGTAGATGVLIENPGAGSAKGNQINASKFKNLVKAISIGSGVIGTKVGPGVYESVTTIWDFASGTGTYLNDMTNPVLYAGRPMNVANGSQLYISDANSTCTAGGGSGRPCAMINGTWGN
jgi:hypothetical protein